MTEASVDAVLKKLLLCNVRNKYGKLLGEKLQMVKALIQDAESKVLSNNSVNEWLRDVRDVCYEAEDVLDEFVYRSSASSCLINRRLQIAEFRSKSQLLYKKVEQIVVKAHRCSLIQSVSNGARNLPRERIITSNGAQNLGRERLRTSYMEVYGRKGDFAVLMDMLLCPLKEEEERNVHIISIVGMGGVGKSTLAKQIFNDARNRTHFDARGWVHISQNANASLAIKDVINSLEGPETNENDGLETVLLLLRNLVEGKKFLLVLDDVCSKGRAWWEPIQNCLTFGAKGSRILVTTRVESVARMMGSTEIHHLGFLSDDDCWELFSGLAFDGAEPREELERIGRELVEKCKGLPLAAIALGGLMRTKRTVQEWTSVLKSNTWNLEVPQDDAVSVLQLSYSHLPTMLKQCLTYCSNFPKDCEIEADTLIKLWMAQGYLSLAGNEDMEKIGYHNFQELCSRAFFQSFNEDVTSGGLTFGIHDLVHDFLITHSKNECCTMAVDRIRGSHVSNSSPTEACHLTLDVSAQSSYPVSMTKLQQLRSIVILSDYAFVSTKCLHQLFKHSRLLRALHFSNCSIEQIPSEIGKLILLRYLNLSYNRNLKELPDAVCNLYYLQTLNLNGCDNLEKLPEGMGKLVNLRHLEILWTSGLKYLPKSIGKLSSLRILNRFVISSSSSNKACNLGDLENLKKLQEYLYIDGLADLTIVDEARKADLKSKTGLLGLDLWFSGVGNSKISSDEVLEALQPPPELQYLGIHYCGGMALPSWMASLTKLKDLILFNCGKCEIVPCMATLGTLSCLESLEIRDIENVIELSFDVEVPTDIAFPRLKRLYLYNMRQWEDWEVTAGSEEDDATILPGLRQLTIGNCPKLKALPDHLQATPLEELSISECPILNEWLHKAENWGKVSHIPNIQIDGQDKQKDGRASSDFTSSSRRFNRTSTRVRSRVL